MPCVVSAVGYVQYQGCVVSAMGCVVLAVWYADLPFVHIWSGLSRFLALVLSPDSGQCLSRFLLCVPISELHGQ